MEGDVTKKGLDIINHLFPQETMLAAKPLTQEQYQCKVLWEGEFRYGVREGRLVLVDWEVVDYRG